MRVVIASDADGMSMKESIKEMLIADGHEVVDYSETPAADFVDSATAVAKDHIALWRKNKVYPLLWFLFPYSVGFSYLP